MTRSEFNNIMTELTDNFGEKIYPPARISIIWAAVQGLDGGEFRGILRHLVMNERFAPAPGKIISACYESLNRQMVAEKRKKLEELQASGTQCRWCGNCGTVSAHPKDPRIKRGQPFAFRCDCAAGDISGTALPVWHHGMLKDWEALEYSTKSGDPVGPNVSRIDPIEIVASLTRGLKPLGPGRREA